jgi:hypothetical protein
LRVISIRKKLTNDMDTAFVPCSPSSTHKLERLAISALLGILGGMLAWHGMHTGAISDFTHLWFAAHALLAGRDPYTLIGPGREFQWPLPMLYPLPAVLVALPFAPLSAHGADIAFAGISTTLLAYALTRDGYHKLPVVISMSFFMAVTISQWSPLLVAASLLPAIGFLLAVKPTIGAALFLYRPRWITFIGGSALVLACFVVQPGWLAEWFAATREATHVTAPILHPGGPLVLLALLRWRRPEARLLIAMACIPHTTLLYESLPLFLVPETLRQSVLLAALTWVARTVEVMIGPYPSLASHTGTTATIAIAMCYLPCVAMILQRPNEGSCFSEFAATQ